MIAIAQKEIAMSVITMSALNAIAKTNKTYQTHLFKGTKCLK